MSAHQNPEDVAYSHDELVSECLRLIEGPAANADLFLYEVTQDLSSLHTLLSLSLFSLSLSHSRNTRSITHSLTHSLTAHSLTHLHSCVLSLFCALLLVHSI